MEKPTYDLFRTSFYVDVFKEELTQKDNESNVIPLKGCSYSENGYVIPYHVEKQRKATTAEIRRNEHRTAYLPQLSSIDPKGMSQRVNLPIGQVFGKSDYQLLTDPMALLERKMDFLPKVQILKMEYLADITKLEFTRNDFDHPDILRMKAHREYMQDASFACSGYLHLGTHKLVEFPADVKELPANVVFFRLPPNSEIDPYQWAIQNHIDVTHWLRWHPIPKVIKAETLQISDSPVALRASMNRKMETSKKVKSGRQRIGVKPKGGQL